MLNPTASMTPGFTIEPRPEEPGGFVVRGSRPERWVRQTEFANDEAVGYLADRLDRLGVEEELAKGGARPGASVTIVDDVFDSEPTAGTQPTRRLAGPGAAPMRGSTRPTGCTPPSGWPRSRPAGRTESDAELADERRLPPRTGSDDAARSRAGELAAAGP